MTGIFAAEGPNGNWIPGDPNEFYWGSVAFLIIVAVFVMKGLPVIKAAMKAQTTKVEGELASAEQAKADAEAELDALTSSLGDAGAEAEAIVADARKQATRLEADLIARAETDVAEAKERARIEVAAQRDQALADLRAAV
ncbi:MAG: ATP synthase F0 subunit B, partial [Acidimicrobiales bacterium]|nr:ATP synthase F0 subunit B [Acidimicrobiales bacterium]